MRCIRARHTAWLYDDVIDNSGLLGHAETAMFDKHFTEMLRTEMFKDTVLGDGGTDGTADKAIYTGNLSDYHLTALDAQGNVVANPHLNWNSVLRDQDRRHADRRRFCGRRTGNPLLDANGNPLVNEGTDLVIGVEQFVFADQTINPQAYFDIAPTLDLNYVAVAAIAMMLPTHSPDNRNSPYARGTGWTGGWNEVNDSTRVAMGVLPITLGKLLFNLGNTGWSNNASVNGNGRSAQWSISRGSDKCDRSCSLMDQRPRSWRRLSGLLTENGNQQQCDTDRQHRRSRQRHDHNNRSSASCDVGNFSRNVAIRL